MVFIRTKLVLCLIGGLLGISHFISVQSIITRVEGYLSLNTSGIVFVINLTRRPYVCLSKLQVHKVNPGSKDSADS